MAESSKEVPVFDDMSHGITQFIMPSIDGGSIQDGVANLQEPSFLDLPAGSENTQFIEILGENGEVQYLQLLPDQQEQIAGDSSSNFVDLGSGVSSSAIQLVQTSDGNITYLSPEEGTSSGLSNDILQATTFRAGENMETVVQVQDNATQVLSENNVTSFVNGMDRPVSHMDHAGIVKEVVNVVPPGSGSIPHGVNVGLEQSNALSDQELEESRKTIFGEDAASGDFIYLQNNQSSNKNVGPVSLSVSSSASFGSANGNVPLKVIEIPARPVKIPTENLQVENITADNIQSAVPVKVHLPPSATVSVRDVSDETSALHPVSTTIYPNQRTISDSIDSTSVKVITQHQLESLITGGAIKLSGSGSFVSSLVNNGDTMVQISKTGNKIAENTEVSADEVNKILEKRGTNTQDVSESEGKGSDNSVHTEESVTENITAEQKKEALDLNQPIELNSHTVVTVNGKKCLLRVDPLSKQLVAYPVKPEAPKRPRGRPRKQKADESVTQKATEGVEEEEEDDLNDELNEVVMETAEDTNVQTEKESHALEGLLGLSDIDGRRKSLRSKKKPKTLVDEYEIGAIEGVDDEESSVAGFTDNPKDKDVSIPLQSLKTGADGVVTTDQSPVVIRGLNPEGKRGRGRPRTKVATTSASQTRNQLQNYLANLGLPVKRGRGRPRRSLPPGVTGPVCAYVLPAGGGQTVVMAATQKNNHQATDVSSIAPQILPTTVLPVIKPSRCGTESTLSTSTTSTPTVTAADGVMATTAVTTVLNSAVTTTSVVATGPSDKGIILSPVVSVIDKQTAVPVDKPKVTVLSINPVKNPEVATSDCISTTVKIQGGITKVLPAEVTSIQPTVIPIVRSLASGNITMTTATISKKPDPLKAEHTTSRITNNQVTVSNTTPIRPNPVFTVVPEKGRVPIIVRCVDIKSGQVRLKKVGGADNKLSQDIMNGQRLDVIEKGLTRDASTPQVQTALDGTLTVLYQKQKEEDAPHTKCEVLIKSEPTLTQENELGVKCERTTEAMEDQITDAVSGVCEQDAELSVDVVDSGPESSEDGEVDVVTADDDEDDKSTLDVEEEEDGCIESAVDSPVQTAETEQLTYQEVSRVPVEGDLNTESEQVQKSQVLNVTLLGGISESNLVMQIPSTTEQEEQKPFVASSPSESGEGLPGVDENVGVTSEPLSTEEEDLTEQKDVLHQATVIQLPQELVPVVVNKTSVQQIGLLSTEAELEQLKCCKCGFQAFYEHQYREHISTHSDVELHKCKCCQFVSFTKEELVTHFKKVHPKLLCTVCHFMAEHKYTIKRHMQRHDPHGITCELCGKKYKDQYILKIHIKMVHMPAEVLFECEVCQKKFTRKAHLKRHMRTHDPEKPFKCLHCDYRGCERSDITKHVVIHDEPKFWCEVCGKNFRHIKNKELHLKRHRGQRDYKCGVCDFYGYTFTDIRKHIERKHAEHRNIMCQNCGCKFRNETMLKDHSKYCCEMLLVEPGVLVPKSEMNLADPASQGIEDSDLNDTSQVLNGEGLHSTGHYIGEDEGTVMEEQVTLSDEVSVTFGDQCIDGQEQLDIGEDHMMDTSLNDMTTPVSSGDFVTVSQDQSIIDSQSLEGQVISITGLEVGQHISASQKMVLGDTGYSIETVYGGEGEDDLSTDIAGGEESMVITM